MGQRDTSKGKFKPSNHSERACRQLRIPIKQIPGPDAHAWIFADVDVRMSDFRQMLQVGLIEVVETISKNKKIINTYRTRRDVYEYITGLPEPDTLPCGHTGIRCIEAGITYSCTDPDCEARFSRETAEAVIA